MVDLWYLDESGFAPTLPTGYTWARTGRALVWDEPPQAGGSTCWGRSPSVAQRPGCLERPGRQARQLALLEFVWRDVPRCPARPSTAAGYRRARPCVVVLDNYSVHRSAVVTAALADLERVGVGFYYLPPYSPELNRIEDLWRHVKYEELPVRSYRTLEALRTAVTDALNQHAVPLHTATETTTNLPLDA